MQRTENGSSPPEGSWGIGRPKAQVSRLVVLPFKKSVEIAVKSIRVRFFRSLITTMTLVLAVAFLSYVNVGTDVANGLLASGDPALRQALSTTGYDIEPDSKAVDSSPKQRWIVILSLLVCVVGIVNAQLMAVTERFREIGTMKCLGALDRFILRLFLLEAGIQGAMGSLVGAILGAVAAVLWGAVGYGAAAVSYLPVGSVITTLFHAVLVGCGLSLIGVLYPAVVAARMEPVEAMRTDI
jgi:putative ABC transport system permease protein